MESIMTSQSTFTSCMHDQMLESNRDDVKLEAMRCVTVMTAKGKLSVPRTLFPQIVKNVSSKNAELKKLIYLYLTNFADQEPDLALLPVASLQKNLKSPNPLIRSSAIKVLTSMRLSILSAILMATIRNAINDLSPYVRKTVAHSIIKLYRLEPELQSDLIEYIERMFNDKNSMVMSSAVATFEIVCPDRLDLVQKHYKRLCFLLADCNEWGQATLLNLLKRFVVTTHKQIQDGKLEELNLFETDPKILLRAAKSLIHSNNSSVVMNVIKLYIAIANQTEVRSTITKPMIRLLCSHREVQLIVLNMIEEMISVKSGPNMANLDDSRVEDTRDNDEEKSVTNIKKLCGNINEISNTKVPFEVPSQGTSIRTSTSPESSVPPEGSDPQLTDNEGANDGLLNEDVTLVRDEYIPLDSDMDAVNSIKDTRIDEMTDSNEAVEEKQHEEDCDDEDENDDDDDEEVEDEEDDDEAETASDEEDESDESETDESEDDDIIPTSNNISLSRTHDANKRSVDMTPWNDINPIDDPNIYREIFRPYIKSFFVKHNECTQVRLAKLKILTNLSSPINVTLVLRELQAYIAIYVDDKEFVSAAIHAMGRCATIVKEVAHICLNGLTLLLSNNNEHVVAEAIVVLRSQIINKQHSSVYKANGVVCEGSKASDDQNVADDDVEDPAENERIISAVIKQVTRLLPKVTAPQARATILWILAEFCQTNKTAAKCSPEVLRLMAKSFCTEDNIVKLQCLTLASKFLLTLDKDKPERAELHKVISLLANYLFSLAKYDVNYDVRDRGRFLRKLLDDEQVCRKIVNCAY